MSSTTVFITSTVFLSFLTYLLFKIAYPSHACRTNCAPTPKQPDSEIFVDYRPSGLQSWEERTRYSTSYSPGSTTVYGLPRKGGVYILKNAFAPEFGFLGLDRFVSLRSGRNVMGSLKQDYPIQSSDEEEKSCNKCKFDKQSPECILLTCYKYANSEQYGEKASTTFAKNRANVMK